MYIEQNIFDNVFYTILNIEGKTKDTVSQKHDHVAVGGTFDHIHIGHKLLLTMTIFAVDIVGDDQGGCSAHGIEPEDDGVAGTCARRCGEPYQACADRAGCRTRIGTQACAQKAPVRPGCLLVRRRRHVPGA